MIEQTTFTGQTLAAQKPELLAYLQENAADYFDAIEADSSGNISCYVGETVALLIGMDGTTARKVTLANGNAVQCVNGGHTSPNAALWQYAKKTTNGVLLVSVASMEGSTNYGKTVFFITKNEGGDTCIVGSVVDGAISDVQRTYFFADIKNDTTIFTPVSNAADFSTLSRSMTATSLTPVVFNCGHHAPKIYIATFNQFALTECDVNINGKSYASDGVCVLSD
jgi:hypothetical protein